MKVVRDNCVNDKQEHTDDENITGELEKSESGEKIQDGAELHESMRKIEDDGKSTNRWLYI